LGVRHIPNFRAGKELRERVRDSGLGSIAVAPGMETVFVDDHAAEKTLTT